jgi:phosphopantetheinyl transferase
MENRRQEFLWSRLLLRWALASCSGKKMEDLEFDFGRHGKPHLKNIPLEFNLSHTEKWVACAVSRRKLGIDVEVLESPGRNDRRWHLLAMRYFSNPEKKYLFSLPEAEQPDAFLRIFTLKEATVKATGEGLATGLASFSVPLPIREESSLWPWEYFSNILGSHDACLALAVENSDRTTLVYKVWEWRLEEFERMLENHIPGHLKDSAVPV